VTLARFPSACEQFVRVPVTMPVPIA
jgi:hypothetical protein